MTTLRTAAHKLMEAMEKALRYHGVMLLSDPPQDAWKYHRVEQTAHEAITALRAALADNDKRMAWYRERKANWDLQRKLVSETEERDRQHREYEEARLAALSDDPLRLVAENRLRILFANKWVQADSRGTSCREPLGDPYEALCKAIHGASK